MFQECKKAHLSLWQCPPFLFLIMGIVNIVAMVATYILASRRAEEPQIAALIVIGVAVFIFTIGNIIINSFNRMAEANRLKSEFIYIISHQLRSPLSILRWTLDMLQHRLLKTKEYSLVENDIYTLHHASDYLIRLANSLLAVNRVESGDLILKKEKFSLPQLTSDMVKLFFKYAEASNIKLKLENHENVPDLLADREKIGLVIQNLVDNAIRYTRGSGGVTITIRQEGDNLRWSIQDGGIGINPDKQKYIFQKFFRSEDAKGEQPYGSGLGLYIAKKILEACGGKIGFQSEDGKGSIFWFTLPITTDS